MLNIKPMIVVAAAVLLPAAAQAETYVCDIKDPGRYNTIPPRVVVELAKDGQSAVVTDNIIYQLHKKPLPASFVKNTSKTLRVRWTIEEVPFAGGGKSDMKFSLVHKKSSKRAFLTLTLPSYDNTDSGNGTCRIEN